MTDEFEQDEAGDSPDDHADDGSLGDASPPPDESQGDTIEPPDAADTAPLALLDAQYETAIKDALAEEVARYHVANNLGDNQLHEAIALVSAHKIDEDVAIETCIRMEGSADNYAAYLSRDEAFSQARVTEQMKFRIQEVKNRILDGS